jgi:hypothetical protein
MRSTVAIRLRSEYGAGKADDSRLGSGGCAMFRSIFRATRMIR